MFIQGGRPEKRRSHTQVTTFPLPLQITKKRQKKGPSVKEGRWGGTFSCCHALFPSGFAFPSLQVELALSHQLRNDDKPTVASINSPSR